LSFLKAGAEPEKGAIKKVPIVESKPLLCAAVPFCLSSLALAASDAAPAPLPLPPPLTAPFAAPFAVADAARVACAERNENEATDAGALGSAAAAAATGAGAGAAAAAGGVVVRLRFFDADAAAFAAAALAAFSLQTRKYKPIKVRGGIDFGSVGCGLLTVGCL
jgi:hypothetical protein